MRGKVNMGGRGAWSGKGVSSGTGNEGRNYKDVTKQFQGMTLHEFENAVRDRKTEYAGIFDSDGNLVVAVTSGSSGSVGIPKDKIQNAAVLTHNHPYQGSRTIGGTFSEADVMVHIKHNVGETRAVTNGPNEHTYIIRAGKNANKTKLLNNTIASTKNGAGSMAAYGAKAFTKAKAKMKAAGFSDLQIEAKREWITIGSMKNFWKTNAASAGFDYIEVKEAHW